MTIDALLLDADGVVIFPWRFAQYLEQEHHITPTQTRAFFGGVFLDCLVGRADLKEALIPFLAQWGWTSSVDAFVEKWFSVENAPDPQMLAAIAELRACGVPCYLATNQERYRLAYMRTEMNFDTLFDGLFVSCEVGHTKHDVAYFAAVTHALEMEPARILFWDDTLGNVETARAFGWQAEQFVDFASFQATMAHYQ